MMDEYKIYDSEDHFIREMSYLFSEMNQAPIKEVGNLENKAHAILENYIEQIREARLDEMVSMENTIRIAYRDAVAHKEPTFQVNYRGVVIVTIPTIIIDQMERAHPDIDIYHEILDMCEREYQHRMEERKEKKKPSKEECKHNWFSTMVCSSYWTQRCKICGKEETIDKD